MRPLAAVLSLKRSKQPDSAQPSADSSAQSVLSHQSHHVHKSRSSVLNKAPKTQVVTDPSARLRPPFKPASSSSSEGSASIRTPEDEAMMVFPKSERKRRWSNWLGWPKSPQRFIREVAEDHADRPRKDTGRNLLPTPRDTRELGSDTDDDEDDGASDSSGCVEDNTQRRATVTTTTASALAQSNLKALLRNSLLPPLAPPPLVDIPAAHQFPRSSNKAQKLPFVHSMESQLHIRILLRRLERRNISRVEVASIASFSTREKPSGPMRPVKKSDEDLMAYSSMRVGPLSRGLRRWVHRPCYEERVLVWAADKMGNVACTKVLSVGRGLAVAELEFSERIEVIAGMGLDDGEFEASLRPLTLKSQPPPIKVPLRNSSFINNAPSPLRFENTLSSSSVAASKSLTNLRSKPPRGVRFADQPTGSDDDNVPLGHAVQMKKAREERGKRAQEERARQLKEEAERRAIEEEDRLKAVRAKQAREERANSSYAEEYTAARQRIESQRAGADNYTAFRQARAREREPSYSRPVYDSSPSRSPQTRKSASETDRRTDTGSSRNNSPGHSRPSSVYSPPPDTRRSSVMQGPSSYHASVEDLSAQRGRRKSAMVSSLGNGYPRSDASGSRVSLPRSSSLPVAAFVYPTFVYGNVPAPPVPQMPQMPWAMPLLPPTPAFMLQSYTSSSPGSTPSRESSPSRQQFAGMPMAVGNFGGIPQMPAPAVPRQPLKGGNEAQARRDSFREAAEKRSSRTPHALPASRSSRELRQLPSESTSKTTKRTPNFNRRTSLA